jgi:hypothetical protein
MSEPDRKTPAPDGWRSDGASRRDSAPVDRASGQSASGDGAPRDSAPGDPTGSPPSDSSPGGVRASKSRKRITLRISAPALELPSEVGTSGASFDDELGNSVELALPADLDPPEIAAAEADEAGTDGLDGWSRSRPSATVPPPAPRPRSEHPPAPRTSESTDSLRLVSARSRPSPAHPPDLAAEMNDRFALGDFTGALRAAELLLGQDPKDVEATQVATVSRDRLVSFYLARLGGLEAVLDLKVAGAEVRWLGLDHRAGFLLSCVDGTTTVEEIVDVSGMPKHEALRLLAELLDGGAVTRIG